MDPLTSSGSLEVVGLPLHPLVVHAVVVLTPLTALALVLGSLWPAARRRLGIVTPLAALLLTVLVPITVAAGDALAAVVGAQPAVVAHGDYGRMLLPWVLGMLAVATVQWAWFRWGEPRVASSRAGRARLVSIALAALAVVVAIGSTTMVVLIGDSGARAVWGGILG